VPSVVIVVTLSALGLVGFTFIAKELTDPGDEPPRHGRRRWGLGAPDWIGGRRRSAVGVEAAAG
jgi:hypothetical protein